MNIQGCIPRFVRGHGSLILTILSGIGMIATVVATAKQAPKAKMALIEAEQDKQAEILKTRIDAIEHPDGYTESYYEKVDNVCNDMNDNPPKLSGIEKLRVVGPIYAPVILLGLGTLGCMAGAQILNTRQQAMTALALSAVTQNFGAYRDEIRKEYGNEADRKAYAESQKKVKALEAEVKRLENIKGVCSFGIATIPGLIFRSDMANVERAFLHFNRNLILRGWADLAELYSFLGLPEEWNFVKKEQDENFGWNAYANEVDYGVNWLDYGLKEVETEDGQKAYLIYFDVPPYRIDGELDVVGDVKDEGAEYGGYDIQEAERMLRQGVDRIPLLIDSASHYVGAPMLCGW